MLTPISTKIEEFEEKILNKILLPQFDILSTDGDSRGYRQRATDFIVTLLEQRDEEWRELVGYVRESAESCAVLARENESNNIRNNIIRPLDDVITKSKEI